MDHDVMISEAIDRALRWDLSDSALADAVAAQLTGQRLDRVED